MRRLIIGSNFLIEAMLVVVGFDQAASNYDDWPEINCPEPMPVEPPPLPCGCARSAHTQRCSYRYTRNPPPAWARATHATGTHGHAGRVYLR